MCLAPEEHLPERQACSYAAHHGKAHRSSGLRPQTGSQAPSHHHHCCRMCVCAPSAAGSPRLRTWPSAGTGCGNSRRKHANPSADCQQTLQHLQRGYMAQTHIHESNCLVFVLPSPPTCSLFASVPRRPRRVFSQDTTCFQACQTRKWPKNAHTSMWFPSLSCHEATLPPTQLR